MNAYRPEASYHRPLFAAASLALTAVTFALAIALPAAVEPEPAALLASNPAAHVSEAGIQPVRLGVVEVCAPAAAAHAARSNVGQES